MLGLSHLTPFLAVAIETDNLYIISAKDRKVWKMDLFFLILISPSAKY